MSSVGRALSLAALIMVAVFVAVTGGVHLLAANRDVSAAKVIAITCHDGRVIHDQMGTAVQGLTQPGLRASYRFIAGHPRDVPAAQRSAFATYLGHHPTRASAIAVDAWITTC